ncbi:unnamed protein product [Effrenium voratum]|uniref:Uncharacterized protein n=1 Tax=Effrenium voratum TaxID=2562239 RepID=A0AA36N2R8_9DINO|nr:unnamed protein product [Effrenium voratum]
MPAPAWAPAQIGAGLEVAWPWPRRPMALLSRAEAPGARPGAAGQQPGGASRRGRWPGGRGGFHEGRISRGRCHAVRHISVAWEA